MTEDVAEKLRNILEEYRGRMKIGDHPKELPDRILALARDFPGDRKMPRDLEPLYAAAQHFWNTYEQLPEGERAPDPLDLEMVCDEVIDALYDFYELR
jgi:hypothetical protein